MMTPEQERELEKLFTLWSLGLNDDLEPETVTIGSSIACYVRVYVYRDHISVYRYDARDVYGGYLAGFRKWRSGRCQRWIQNDWRDA